MLKIQRKNVGGERDRGRFIAAQFQITPPAVVGQQYLNERN